MGRWCGSPLNLKFSFHTQSPTTEMLLYFMVCYSTRFVFFFPKAWWADLKCYKHRISREDHCTLSRLHRIGHRMGQSNIFFYGLLVHGSGKDTVPRRALALQQKTFWTILSKRFIKYSHIPWARIRSGYKGSSALGAAYQAQLAGMLPLCLQRASLLNTYASSAPETCTWLYTLTV